MNIRRLKLQRLLPQKHQTMQQHLISKTNTEVKTVFLLKRNPEKQQQEGTSPELDALCDRILEIIQLEERVGLPSRKSCDRTKLKAEVGKVNEAVKMVQAHNITELNSLMCATAYVTTERMGMITGRKGEELKSHSGRE